MGNRNVYGKRQTAQQRLTAQIFGGSSSPACPAPVPFLRVSNVDSPSRNTRAAVQRLKDGDASFFKVPDISTAAVDDIAEYMERLNITTTAGCGLDESTAAASTIKEQSPLMLRERSVNQDNKQQRRRPRKISKALRTSSPSLPKSLKATHTRFDDNGNVSSIVESLSIIKLEDSLSQSQQTEPLSSRHQQKPITTSADSYAHLTTYAQPLLSLCSDPSGRKSIGCFQEWSNSVSEYLEIIKIAEASYGEVYRLSLAKSRFPLRKSDESVLKLIALKPPPLETALTARDSKRIAAMSDILDVTNEARVLRHMSPVPGFTNFRDVRVLRGRLPSQFVAAWKRYNKNVKKSLFPDPSRKVTYADGQLWAVVEMQDAGTDLESLQERGLEIGIFAAWDIFWGVAGAAAKGEEWAAFEHRDLHMGNICVRPLVPLSSEADPFLNPAINSLNLSRTLNYTGIETTLIDYTLSRAVISSTALDFPVKALMCTPESEDHIAFYDLSKDDAIFAGDATEEYQYEIYRLMRATVLHGDPIAQATTTKKSRNKETEAWRGSHRLTTLVWLHFVLHKLLEAAKMVEHGGGELEKELWRRLEKVERVLGVDVLGKGGLTCAGDLVLWAIGKGWLREEEVLGNDEDV